MKLWETLDLHHKQTLALRQLFLNKYKINV